MPINGNDKDSRDVRERVNRKFDRRDANHLDVTIECQGDTYDGVLEDISPNGVRIKCEDDLPSRGTIQIHIPKGEKDGDGELTLKGILRWTNTITEAGVELTGKTKKFQ